MPHSHLRCASHWSTLHLSLHLWRGLHPHIIAHHVHPHWLLLHSTHAHAPYRRAPARTHQHALRLRKPYKIYI